MAINRFDGDPVLKLTENGATLSFNSGQPLVTQGFENYVNISLFTEEGWWGNDLTDNPDEKIGSNFQQVANQPITLQGLNDIRQSAEKALINPAFGSVEATVSNPRSNFLDVDIRITSPGGTVEELRLTKNAANWKAQAREERIDDKNIRVETLGKMENTWGTEERLMKDIGGFIEE